MTPRPHHFAVIAPPLLSHVRTLEPLASALLDRGHRVTWIAPADVAAMLRDRRIGFAAVGTQRWPPGALAAFATRAARAGGPLGLRGLIRDMAGFTDLLCTEGRQVLQHIGAESVIADTMEAAGGLLAEGAGLPCISVACALPVNREPRIPLPVMPWGYAQDEAALHRNRVSTQVYDWLMRPHGEVIARHARALGLAPRDTLAQCLSTQLQISQTPARFDFPRQQAPACFHALGPLRAPAADEPPLGLPVRDDRPFVFASLGTTQGWRLGLFRRIARACRALDAQLLVAHCGGLNAQQAASLQHEGATWVTDFAPQRAALARADAVVSHAGLNTVLDALVAGTPMLALPITFDQPGAAARLVHAGAGLRLSPTWARTKPIERALARLLHEPAFAARAAALGRDVDTGGGTPRAVALIEQAVAGGPSLAEVAVAA